jgi:fibro-slime domain-containing protein
MMNRRSGLLGGTLAFLACGLAAACGSSSRGEVPFADQGGASSSNDGGTLSNNGGSPSSSGGSLSSGVGDASLFGADVAAPSGDDGGTPGTLHAVVRDFRFYDANDSTTVPDFENPPYGIDANGNPSPGYQGPWDDHAIVASTLGADGKPVYANPGGTTLTTHGQADFDKWYRDVPGTNIHVDWPVTLVANADGSYGYDSAKQGALYDPSDPSQGRGFFPIDDGTPYATMFGDQGKLHNYSFTFELHTVFRYKGGEYFNFRGDDDVYVFVNNKLVINLGGVHSAEPAQVNVDSLGLTVGQTYPLDFFSTERHVVGSNILFETTLSLQPPPL